MYLISLTDERATGASKIIMLATAALLAALVALACCASAQAYTMEVKTDASYYSKASTSSKYKKGTMTFGTELNIKSKGSTWSTFTVSGKTRYIKTKYLQNKYLVADGYGIKLYSTASTSSVKGYLATGEKLKYVGSSTKNGVKYMKVVAAAYSGSYCDSKTYSSATGYVPESKAPVYTTYKMVNANTKIYAKASSSASSTSISKGTNVKMISSNSTWSKVICDGETGYIDSSKLEDRKMNVLANQLSMRKTANSNSKCLGYVYWSIPVTIIREFDTGGTITWMKISYGGTTALVQSYNEGNGDRLGYTDSKRVSEQCSSYSSASTSSSSANVYKYSRPKVIRDFGTWVKVDAANGKQWMKSDDLKSLKYTVTGKYYSSAEKIVKVVKGSSGVTSSGSLTNANVVCTSIAKDSGYMKVIVDGKTRYMKASCIVDDPYVSSTRYVATSGPKCYERATTDSRCIGHVSYMWKVNILGKARTVSSGTYTAIEYNDDVAYVYQKTTTNAFTDTQDKFQYKTSNAMQKDIVDNAKDMVFNKKTDYSNGKRGKVSSGVHYWDCSSFVAWLLDTAVRDYTGSSKWSVAEGTTSWTSSRCKARLIGQTQYCVSSSKLYPTTTLWDCEKDKASDLDIDDLECGDVLCFRMSPSVACPEHDKTVSQGDHCADHVGVYLGNGQFAHCTKRFGCCVITPIAGDYAASKRMVKAMRFLPTDSYIASIKSGAKASSASAMDADGKSGTSSESFNPDDAYFEGGADEPVSITAGPSRY